MPPCGAGLRQSGHVCRNAKQAEPSGLGLQPQSLQKPHVDMLQRLLRNKQEAP
jgi:hypothetical protein